MNRIWRGALVCAAIVGLMAAIFSCSTLGLSGGRNSTAVNGPYSTDFIAGDGAGNGPGNGTDAGDISISDDGTDITISVDMDETTSWSYGNLHIYIGEDFPKNPQGKLSVAPGQFTYSAADGTGDGDQWTGTFPIPDVDGPLTILIHGEGLNGSSTDGHWEPSCQGEFGSYGLYYGSTDLLVGTVTLSLVGDAIVCTVTLTQPSTFLITEAQFYLDLASNGPPPTHAPGQWPYDSGDLAPGVTSYTFPPVPLADLGIVYDPQNPTQFTADLNFAFHAAIYNTNGGATESATAWNPDCRTPFLKPNGQPHWKSWTECADAGPCDWVWVPGGEPDEETLWAIYDATDPMSNWFPNEGINRWGWFIEYQPVILP